MHNMNHEIRPQSFIRGAEPWVAYQGNYINDIRDANGNSLIGEDAKIEHLRLMALAPRMLRLIQAAFSQDLLSGDAAQEALAIKKLAEV